jgi:hypothetical protein
MKMSFYTAPDLDLQFDSVSAVNVRVKEASATVEKLLRTYTDGYDKFWQTPLTHGDRALSAENFNAMVSVAPDVLLEIQTDGTAFVNFVSASHAEVIGTDLFPERYLTIPYEQNETGAFTELKKDWEQPIEDDS